ncbi:GNAT family N-acetyltransferase [Pseudonocardia sp. N23]|uniref:GNAT family N-acetyltransferase n=1 Tax=Pseudonocardia sp. N23 TaxID=1987376 RepID=UPI000BFC161E|nr:GNAT family N-acetyltransferase [Pseudonocardia sp. N23]GAY07727.1 GCN5-related N-acetyltransferase [Pseudonocardia sp. N23]
MDVRNHRTGDAGVAQWRRQALPLLEADPLTNTIALTALGELATGGHGVDTLLTVHGPRGDVVGAAVRFSGFALLVSGLPATAAAAVADALGDAPMAGRGLFGAAEPVDAFAAARTARTGETPVTDVEMRLWVLDGLVPPGRVAGAPRAAVPGDGPMLVEWLRAFAADVAADHPERPDPDGDGAAGPDPATLVASYAAMGRDVVVWESGGSPVAVAVGRPPAAGVARIGPVYTPPGHRGHGYASAVTAAAATRALAAGSRDVVLFTDIAADVPNRIYARIGFGRAGLHREVRLVPARAGAR